MSLLVSRRWSSPGPPCLAARRAGVLGYWRKHQYKDDEEILKTFHEHGWTIIDPPKYYTLRCPCGLHQRWYHLTPSNPRHGREVLKWAKRFECWK